MPKIQVNDIEMYYERHGRGEPLVLVSGFSVDSTAWEAVVDQFACNYEVIVFDNRGAGQTTVPVGAYSIEQMADDTAALCQALGVEKAHFIGNSMGGCIVQMLAYRHPKLVQSLMIENSVAVVQCGFGYYVLAQLEMIKAGIAAATLIKAALSWCYSYQYLSQPGLFEQLVEDKLANPFPFTVEGYEGQLAALNSFDTRPWVGGISAPTLVIGSDMDLIFPEQSIKALAAVMPGSRYESVSNCGHIPHIEYPNEFVQLVTAFLP